MSSLSAPTADPRSTPARYLLGALFVLGGTLGALGSRSYYGLLAEAPYGELVGRTEAEALRNRLGDSTEAFHAMVRLLPNDAVLGVATADRDRLGALAVDLRVLLFPRRVMPIHGDVGALLDLPRADRLWWIVPVDPGRDRELQGSRARFVSRWTDGRLELLGTEPVDTP